MSIDVGVEAETRETGTAGRAREATVGEQGRTTTEGPPSHSHAHSHYAEIPADLSSGALRRIALDSSPINSAARQKAMRLLELRKVERDVLAVRFALPASTDSETEPFLEHCLSFLNSSL